MHFCTSKLIERIKFFPESHRDVMLYIFLYDNFRTSSIGKEKRCIDDCFCDTICASNRNKRLLWSMIEPLRAIPRKTSQSDCMSNAFPIWVIHCLFRHANLRSQNGFIFLWWIRLIHEQSEINAVIYVNEGKNWGSKLYLDIVFYEQIQFSMLYYIFA